MVKNTTIENIRFDGGRLCLDFINTVHDRLEDPWLDYFQSVDDIINWSFRSGLAGPDLVKSWVTISKREKEKAAAFFKEALKLREMLYTLFLCIARDKKIPETAINDFNSSLTRYYTHIRIAQSSEGIHEEWDYPANSFYRIEAPVVKDAYELLISGKHDRIRECPNCGWLFYDSSKNGKRRWCSMETCGSNVKALNWYHKHKS
jgi:predicted RNA-binding Zn ribbon-like protein